MGYFMVHLAVAQRILRRSPGIGNHQAFLQGSLAPDALAFRPGSQRSDKSVSHFCVGDEGWGFYTNYAPWRQNLRRQVRRFAGQTNRDFLLGYYAHIATDIAYCECFWTPARLTNDELHLQTFASDCYEVDACLMEGLYQRETVWAQLRQPMDWELPGIVTVDDQERMLRALTEEMYANRPVNARYEFRVVTPTAMESFIDRVADALVNDDSAPI